VYGTLSEHMEFAVEAGSLSWKEWKREVQFEEKYESEQPYIDWFIEDYGYGSGDSLKTAIVAFTKETKKFVGIGVFVKDDLKSRPDINFSPWLANLLVHPDFRRRKVGTGIVHKLIQLAKDLKIDTIYLWTRTDKVKWYRSFGFEEILVTFYLFSDIHVMKKQLRE